MKAVKLEEEIVEYLMEKVAATGKSPSGVLRTELGLREADEAPGQSGWANVFERDEDSEALSDFLESSKLQSNRATVQKYLAILSFVYQQKPDRFEEVEDSITGRSRKYFGTSEEELEETGKNVNPHPIPDSPYWAVTNNSTSKKRDILTGVLSLLDYDEIAIQKARNVL